MARLRLIKRRIRTTQNIAKITRAMEMVAALKMKKAQEQAIAARPYTQKITKVLHNLLQGGQIKSHPLFSVSHASKGEKEKTIVLLVAPNRGLCGSLITNLFRTIFSFMEGKDLSFVNYGKKGRDFLLSQNFNILADVETTEPPAFTKAVDTARILKENFLSGQCQKVFLAYSHFESAMAQTPLILPLLPLGEEMISGANFMDEKNENSKVSVEYLFEPQIAYLLDSFLPHFLEIKIYHALLEAYASEQSARMMAMRSATENAQEIMSELTLSYNKERQQVITNEISDIVTAQLGLEG